MFSRHLFKTIVPTIALLIAGCQTINSKLSPPVLAAKKFKVVASHSILCEFLDTIAADTIDLTCLIEGGQDPQTFRPTPSQEKAIAKAQVIFYGGYGLEPQIIDLIESVAEKVPTIPVYETVVQNPIMVERDRKHEEEAQESSHSEETELTADPHIWHDVNQAIAMVDYLQSTMLQINPTQAVLYLENAVKLRDELIQLHPWVQEQIATIPTGQKNLVTAHDSLNYYVRAYELESYQTLQGISPEDSPSAFELRNLVAKIKQSQVPTIFAEATSSDRVIQNIAKEAGVEVSETELLVNGLGEQGTTTDTYTKMMVNNTCAIVNGLGGECQPFEDTNN